MMSGNVSAAVLSADESELVSCFRNLDARGRAGVLEMIGGMRLPTSPVSTVGNAPHVETHGKIGQNFVGNIIGPQTFNVAGSGRKKEK